MKKKALRKDFYMEIKRSFSRFMSIFLIVCLGVAFFAGIRAASPDMKMSADRFYRESSLMDVRVLGTLGLTDSDVDEIRKINGIEYAEPSYSMDVLCNTKNSQLVVKLMSAPQKLNMITVKEGRLPIQSGECLADTAFLEDSGYRVGDTFTVKSGDDTDIEDICTTNTFTIVGAGVTSYYLSMTRGSSSIGSGQLTGFAIIPADDFALEAYTDIYVRVSNSEEYAGYSDEYEDYVETIVERIEDISDSRCEIRFAEVKDDANEKIADGEEKIADAKKELADAGEELEDARKEVSDGERELSDAEKKLSDGEQELIDHKKELEEAKEEIAKGEKELKDAWQDILDGKKELDDGKAEIEENEKKLDDGRLAVIAGKEKLRDGKKQIEEAYTELEKKEKELEKSAIVLEEQQKTVVGLCDAQAALCPPENYSQDPVELVKQIVATQEFFKRMQEFLVASGETADSFYDSLGQSGAQIPKSFITDFFDLNSNLYADPMTWMADMQMFQGMITEVGTVYKVMEGTLSGTTEKLAVATKELNDGADKIASARIELKEKEQEIAEGWDKINESEYELLDGIAKLEDAKKEWDDGYREYLDGLVEYNDGVKELADGKREYEDGKRKIADGEKEIEDAKVELSDAKKELADGKKKLADGEQEYNDAKVEADEKISDAEADLEDAKKQVSDLKKPEWFVLDRNYIETYVEFGDDADRIGALGLVFPVIFFLVAALVALTTMTRMVEEERLQIGTLKALGYTNASIMGKYLWYAFIASLAGSIAGLYIGQKVIPYVVIASYEIMYVNLTVIETPLNLYYSVTSTLVAICCTTVATFWACYRELVSSPAVLMRPVAPKGGKRVFLEKIPWLWQRLNFTKKSTIRNLMRYKKRFFMTVIGIGGCMGLLLVGFGIKDSITTIVSKQFKELRHYSADIAIEEDATDEEKHQLCDKLSKDFRVQSFMYAYQESHDLEGNGVVKNGYVVVPEDPARMSEFIALQDRISGKEYILDDSGVIITEKLAKLLNLKAGDSIRIKDDEKTFVDVPVLAITENYFMHYVYMTPGLYEKTYGNVPDYISILLSNTQNDDMFEAKLGEDYMKEPAVGGITFYSGMESSVGEMIKSMDLVIWVLVIAAGALAFVVLYNLNNININERRRELATLKVLGFYDGEVSSYVNRENVILTVIGTLVGCVIGFLLHRFVILTVELDIMMFGRVIKPISYLYSILITFMFSIIVSLFMKIRLKKIDMVESLKSVE